MLLCHRQFFRFKLQIGIHTYYYVSIYYFNFRKTCEIGDRETRKTTGLAFLQLIIEVGRQARAATKSKAIEVGKHECSVTR